MRMVVLSVKALLARTILLLISLSHLQSDVIMLRRIVKLVCLVYLVKLFSIQEYVATRDLHLFAFFLLRTMIGCY